MLIKNDKSFTECDVKNRQNFAQRKEKKHMVNLEHKTFSLDIFLLKDIILLLLHTATYVAIKEIMLTQNEWLANAHSTLFYGVEL